jgi:hypothetical protein
VSGDVTLIDTGDGAVRRLVSTASELFARPGFAPAALVGGLAVTMRLATAHRATNDVDTVTDGDAPRRVALEYVGDGAASASSRVEISGVNVDVMATEPLPATFDGLPEADLDRLFVLGHRWALESAEPMSIRVVSPTGLAEVEPSRLMVATAPALVACKFHAIADRRDAASDKRESDAIDLVRLIRDLVRVPATAQLFSSAPFDLTALVVTQVQRWLLAGATRTARLVNLSAGVGDARLEPDDISTIGGLFISELTRR